MLQPRQNSPSTRGGKTGVKTSSLNTVGVGSVADAGVGIGVGAGVVVGVGAGAGIVVGVGESEASRASEP